MTEYYWILYRFLCSFEWDTIQKKLFLKWLRNKKKEFFQIGQVKEKNPILIKISYFSEKVFFLPKSLILEVSRYERPNRHIKIYISNLIMLYGFSKDPWTLSSWFCWSVSSALPLMCPILTTCMRLPMIQKCNVLKYVF